MARPGYPPGPRWRPRPDAAAAAAFDSRAPPGAGTPGAGPGRLTASGVTVAAGRELQVNSDGIARAAACQVLDPSPGAESLSYLLFHCSLIYHSSTGFLSYDSCTNA